MKKKLLIVSFSVFICSAAWSVLKNHVEGETKTLGDAKHKWGNQDFDPETFKKGTIEERAKMAASVLEHKTQFIGKDRSDIRKSLGDYSGFYISGMYPTYLIQRANTRADEAWQLVFLINADQKVTDIVIHKNCCYP